MAHSPLDDHIPLITFKSKEWLDRFLKPDMFVFEYGSGGSTIYFAKKVKKIISIEHDKEWYHRVLKVITQESITSCDLFLYEPRIGVSDKLPYTSRSYTSSSKKNAGLQFQDYVRSIDKYPDRSFDLVFIDGRARLSCITHALPKIKPGGYLIFDNSDRPQYQTELPFLLAKYRRIDFFGLAPYETSMHGTSAWEIKS